MTIHGLLAPRARGDPGDWTALPGKITLRAEIAVVTVAKCMVVVEEVAPVETIRVRM